MLPQPLATGVARGTGVVLAQLMRRRRAMMARHLQRIHGPDLSGRNLGAQVNRAFDSYARYWMESFRLRNATRADFESGMECDGIENLVAANAEGRGVVMCMPHLGGWDFGGAWLAAIGYPVTVVVEPVEPPELFEWFTELRREAGLAVLPLGRETTTALLRTLRGGGVVGLVGDRDIAGNGIEVDFFGERTTIPGGPAILALRTGAPLLPCAVYFEGNGHRGVIEPPLDTNRYASLREDVERITQSLADSLARLIRRAPDQWHVFQPNWPSDFK